jgi:hypothetical protein
MITGVHSIIYSINPQADRLFLRDVLQLTGIDAGEGWLIFSLPPGELAVHPADKNDRQELYLVCEDVRLFVEEMAQKGVSCGPVEARNWGQVTRLPLPGGGSLGVYQPSHLRP